MRLAFLIKIHDEDHAPTGRPRLFSQLSSPFNITTRGLIPIWKADNVYFPAGALGLFSLLASLVRHACNVAHDISFAGQHPTIVITESTIDLFHDRNSRKKWLTRDISSSGSVDYHSTRATSQ